MFVHCGNDVNDLGGTLWKEFTLIVPAVSVGNVGQLAVDLLISSTSSNCTRIGYFYDCSILPVVGNDAFSKPDGICGTLVVSGEVYKNGDLKLIVIQQRAPIVKGKQAEYCRNLVDWISKHCFKQVVLLSSIGTTERIDSQITSSQLRYLVTPEAKILQSLFERMSWRPLEKQTEFAHPNEGLSDQVKDYFLPGAGITKKLFQACCKKNISLAVLLTFCSEGDNVPDAINLFIYMNNWLKVIPGEQVESTYLGTPSHLVIPPSWCLLFGSPIHPQHTLF